MLVNLSFDPSDCMSVECLFVFTQITRIPLIERHSKSMCAIKPFQIWNVYTFFYLWYRSNYSPHERCWHFDNIHKFWDDENSPQSDIHCWLGDLLSHGESRSEQIRSQKNSSLSGAHQFHCFLCLNAGRWAFVYSTCMMLRAARVLAHVCVCAELFSIFHTFFFSSFSQMRYETPFAHSQPSAYCILAYKLYEWRWNEHSKWATKNCVGITLCERLEKKHTMEEHGEEKRCDVKRRIKDEQRKKAQTNTSLSLTETCVCFSLITCVSLFYFFSPYWYFQFAISLDENISNEKTQHTITFPSYKLSWLLIEKN